ncbi:MAG: hypothetical protein KF723_09920 [Rhizobiaceae bacterium]|nr:hypothetical protein [Rhizobiaceae bacterium]
MASLGLRTIRIMRRLPITDAFDAHLARCAFAEIWSDRRVTFRQIFDLDPLETPAPGDPRDTAVEAAVLARRRAKERLERGGRDAFRFQQGSQSAR